MNDDLADLFQTHLSSYEILLWLRNEGLPISAITDVMRVERKSVYAWINNGPMRQQNEARLELLYSLLSKNKQSTLGNLYRFWHRPLQEERSLSQLLGQETLDKNTIIKALSELWPVAKKYESQIAKIEGSNHNPILSEIPEVSIDE